MSHNKDETMLSLSYRIPFRLHAQIFDLRPVDGSKEFSYIRSAASKDVSRACHQLKDFVAKMVGFENRIARILKAYLRNGSAENRHLQSKSR